MAVINNLTAFAAAISAVCPIIGCDINGGIQFDPSATPAQITAAQAVAAAYTDTAPQIVPMRSVLGALTDPEYIALVQAAATLTRPALHRLLFFQATIDLSKPAAQALIQSIVTAGILTPARAAAVFVAPPPPVTPVLAVDLAVSPAQTKLFQSLEPPDPAQ